MNWFIGGFLLAIILYMLTRVVCRHRKITMKEMQIQDNELLEKRNQEIAKKAEEIKQLALGGKRVKQN